MARLQVTQAARSRTFSKVLFLLRNISERLVAYLNTPLSLSLKIVRSTEYTLVSTSTISERQNHHIQWRNDYASPKQNQLNKIKLILLKI